MARDHLHLVPCDPGQWDYAGRLHRLLNLLVEDTASHRPFATNDGRVPDWVGLVDLVGLEDALLQRRAEQGKAPT